MICIKLTGGLGNQMFQYALAKHYQSQNIRTYLDLEFYDNSEHAAIRSFSLSVFSITVPILPLFYKRYLYSQKAIWKIARKVLRLSFEFVHESGHNFNDKYLHLTHHAVVTGYFQSQKYFDHIREEIVNDFNINQSLSSRNLGYLETIKKSESVSLHIRRGDYASNQATQEKHGVLPSSYYMAAIKIVNNKIMNAEYFVFTDDVSWVKENLGAVLNQFTIVEGNSSENAWQDLFLMSQCRHAITANSSFSWWGAWLNKNPAKLVIAPEAWCADPQLNAQMGDVVPENWIKIGNF
ncbi:MAG: alpha-1,2-fucosyltransferase [Bacteroidota bacterium]